MSEPERPSEGLVQVLGWPAFPAGVSLAEGVDGRETDPSRWREGDPPIGRGGKGRRCVAKRKNGSRCSAQALVSHVLCPMHAGRIDPAEAARQRARLAQEAKERVRDRAAVGALGALGTRSLIAQTLVDEADNISKAVKVLAKSAAGGDVKSAQALIPWLNQALGNPTERQEITLPSSASDVQSLSTSQLRAIVARGSTAHTDNAG